jgi:hypothetical protein
MLRLGMILALTFVLSALAWSAASSGETAVAAEPMLAHNVYFSLKDNSPAARKKLVEACKKYLAKHEGTVFFAAGTLTEELSRPVNDRDFDVALHIVFKSKAAHDKYQDAPLHQRFIDENKDNWKKVRVFDSTVEQQ